MVVAYADMPYFAVLCAQTFRTNMYATASPLISFEISLADG